MKNIIIPLLIISILLTCFIGCDFEEINEDKNNDSFKPNTNESEFASNAFSADISSNKADEFNTDYYVDTPSFVSYSFTNLDEFYLYAETDEDDISKFPHIGGDYYPNEPVFKYINKDKFIRLEDIFPEFSEGKLQLRSVGVGYYDQYEYYLKDGISIFIRPLNFWSGVQFPENENVYMEIDEKRVGILFELEDYNITIFVQIMRSMEDQIRELSINSLNELLSGKYTILAERIAEYSKNTKN